MIGHYLLGRKIGNGGFGVVRCNLYLNQKLNINWLKALLPLKLLIKERSKVKSLSQK
jgi:hypothetical protein